MAVPILLVKHPIMLIAEWNQLPLEHFVESTDQIIR